MTKTFFLFVLTGILFLPSCVVERPPYAKVEKVMTLSLGMTKEEVSKVLDIPPYDFKSLDSNGTSILIYKYRVTNRKTLPFFVAPKNGMKISGKYVDLFVTYSKEGKATNFTSCTECSETTESQKNYISLNTIITLVSVIAPAILIYLGLTKTP